MIHLLVGPSCTSCRKAKKWFTNYGIEFEERNIINEPLNSNELKLILSMTETGIEEILSTRSIVYQKLNIDFDELSMSQLLVLLSQYPQLLKRPIIYDDHRLQVGYNEEDIRIFMPKKLRKVARMDLYRENVDVLCGDIITNLH
ncbi:transcriptional regulator Spx [Enterococcus sp. 669A]|uniref:Transcriptional regulator Spx n=1 Tax=Candidatus Enterococcus moelleringii TaxID=2815325 RepID=A0ABS3LEJ3_9ENTE|nr:transcriptional regulator Spx [Enterococcus sp. 669A]MBO1308050.1 transcriptional regulator Spx [Enterococcus sp. 669A]